MTNRIKTLLEYGTPEWRSDLKLALLTLFGCAGIVLFFSADSLFGAILLRVIYFRYGMIVSLILLGMLLFTTLKWANIPLIVRVISIVAYAIIAAVILGNSKLLLLVSMLSGFIIGFGGFFLVPPAILAWLIIAMYSWKKGELSSYLTESLFIRFLIIILVLITACYAAVQHNQSSGFTVTDHKIVGIENYYSATFPYQSSDGASGNITVHYNCNTISVSCVEISGSEQPQT